MNAPKDKPLLALDFDGVIHAYSSGWQGMATIPDGPVPGAFDFMEKALEHFKVVIYSTRSADAYGLSAMKKWLYDEMAKHYGTVPTWYLDIGWPQSKPPAFLTIDDRAILFRGDWPDPALLRGFQPWYRDGKAGGAPEGTELVTRPEEVLSGGEALTSAPTSGDNGEAGTVSDEEVLAELSNIVARILDEDNPADDATPDDNGWARTISAEQLDEMANIVARALGDDTPLEAGLAEALQVIGVFVETKQD